MWAMMALMTAVGAVSASIAWFTSNAIVSNGALDASTEAAFFAGGDGSKEITRDENGNILTYGPYIINRPVHFYNLAWLQYMGYFNRDIDRDGAIDQNYFQIDADLDMLELDSALPPIGTTRYPFVGYVDGQNHVVKNANTINSSLISSYNKHPDVLTSVSNTNVAGLFGVIGSMDDSGKVALCSIVNTDPTSTATYSYASNEYAVKNLGIDQSSVSTEKSDTVIGIAVGYENAPVAGVTVNNSTLNIKNGSAVSGTYNSNFSNYTLVGYASDKYKAQKNKVYTTAQEPDVDQGVTPDGGSNWGASIGMKDMYTNLRSIFDNNLVQATYLSSETRNYNDETNYTASEQVYSNAYLNDSLVSQSTETQRFYANYKTEYASYGFFKQTSTNQERFMYLYGGSTQTVSNGTTIANYKPVRGKVNTDGRGHYFRVTGAGTTSFEKKDNADNAAVITYSNNYLSTTYGSTTLYLVRNSPDLQLSTRRSTTGSFDSTNQVFSTYDSKNSRTYYLGYLDGLWKISASSSAYALKDSDNHYLNYSGTGTSPSVGQTLSSATRWETDPDDDIFTTISSSIYYLAFRNGYNIYISTSPGTSNSNYYYLDSGNRRVT